MAIDMRELGVVKVASPCNADWEQMEGDDQARHCKLCQKNVYNLSQMNAVDARALLLEREGKLCVRFYARKDGTVLTADCPKGVQRKRLRLVAAIASAASVVLAGAAFLLDSGGFGPAAARVRMMITGESCSESVETETVTTMGLMVARPPEPEKKKLVGFGQNNAY
ncbi:MAG: hypothetical protein QM723_22220 [Myxococcaceae bacterium]